MRETVMEEDNGRLTGPSSCRKKAEVGVGGDYDAILLLRQAENHKIVSRLESDVLHVNCVMAILAEHLGHQR